MFAGGAYGEGFGQGEADARTGQDKRPRPSFWKGLVSRASYAGEFVRGYHAGYAHGYLETKIEEERRAAHASAEERLADLRRDRARDRESDRER